MPLQPSKNTPTGKMLLGISFVLSKQFSEHLSETVTRGNRSKTMSGAFIGTYKHGYYKNQFSHLIPDGNNFVIIEKAFRMRIDGASQQGILQYLQSNPQYRIKKKNGEHSYAWDKDAVSRLLRDPVYAGALKYGDKVVNLTEYYDFTPALTADEFYKINSIDSMLSSKVLSIMLKRRSKVKADLLRGMVICGHCKKSMSAGVTKNSKGQNYLRYRCETDGCDMKNKGVRAKVLTSYCLNFLDQHRFTTRQNYDAYAAQAKEAKDIKLKQLNEVIRNAKHQREAENSYLEGMKRVLATPESDVAVFYGADDLTNAKYRLDQAEQVLKQAQKEKTRLDGAILTFEKYLELFDRISDILKEKAQLELLNSVLRKDFSNLVVKATLVPPKNVNTRWEVVSHELREPYATFVNKGQFVNGRGERTRTSGLLLPKQAR